MFGRDYLETRRHLAEDIRAVRALARRANVGLSEQESTLEDQLRSPFRIVVTGSKEAGKSTFLGELVGRQLSVLSTAEGNEAGIQVYRDHSYRKRDTYLPVCNVVYLDGLGDLELVDASGLQQLSAEQQEALKEIVTTADFIYWVLPAGNPWSAVTWDMLSDLYPTCRGDSGIVLQQSDSRLESDIPILLGHVRDLCIQRVGHALPLFAVSALTGAGMRQCISDLDHHLSRSLVRRREMKGVYDQAFALLRRIEEEIDQRARTLVDDQQYFQSIEAQIDRNRENEVRMMDESLIQVGAILKNQIEPVMAYTQRCLSLPRTLFSLFGREDSAARVEKALIEMVTEAADKFGENEGQRLLNHCREKWMEMRPRLAERLAVDVSEFDEKSFEKQRRIFTEGMVRSTRQVLVGMRFRRFLDEMIVYRNRKMQHLLKVVLVIFSVAGLSGTFTQNPLGWLPLTLAGMGVIALGMMFVFAAQSKKKILLDFSDTLLGSVPALVLLLRDGYLDRMRAFYMGYTPMFEGIRRRMADAILEVKPQQKAASQLFVHIKAVEQEIL